MRADCLTWWTTAWDVLAVVLCVLLIFGVLAGVVVGIAHALAGFDWDRYSESPKLRQIKALLTTFGIDLDDLLDGSFPKQYQGMIVDASMKVLEFLGSIALTLLLFFFMLFAMIPGVHENVPRSDIKLMMQRFLFWKTVTSLVIAFACTLALWAMGVELVLIFGLITFALNFIPNIGSFFAILAPVCLTAVEPSTGLMDILMVAVVPFAIHNTLGNVIEPKAFGQYSRRPHRHLGSSLVCARRCDSNSLDVDVDQSWVPHVCPR